MSLNMYLYRRQEAHPEGKGILHVTRQGRTVAVPQAVATTQPALIGQWHQANAIHGWFVDNVQDGEDDCREYDVTRDQLSKLLYQVLEVRDASKLVPGKVSVGQTLAQGKWVDILEDGQIIEDASVAKEMLPTREGFFFGSTDYDEFYYRQLVETEEILKAALASPKDAKFSYQSWW